MSRNVDRKDLPQIFVGLQNETEEPSTEHRSHDVWRFPFGLRRVSTTTYQLDTPMVHSAFRHIAQNDPEYLKDITQSRTTSARWLRKRG